MAAGGAAVLGMLAVLLNLVLIATGVFQWVKLNPVWGGLAVAIGLANLLALWKGRRSEVLIGVAAFGCVAAIGAGVVRGVGGARRFAETARTSESFTELFSASYDLSYGLAYAGAGLLTMVTLVALRRPAG